MRWTERECSSSEVHWLDRKSVLLSNRMTGAAVEFVLVPFYGNFMEILWRRMLVFQLLA